MLKKWLQQYIVTHPHQDKRTAIGVLAGKVGLLSNLFLVLIKLLAGWMAGSVSMITDAMNNLADSASSIFTLFGFRAAAKPPDKEHPYGHERFEYISGFVISIIIVFVGFQFLLTSIERILDPTSLQTSPLVFFLLVISMGIKYWQGKFYRTAATHISSNTLHSAAADSINDVFITLVVFVASLVEARTGWLIDGYAGVLLAIFIIYNGIQMIRHAIDDLLGSRPSLPQLAQMKEVLDQVDSIVGYHDLLVHNYGPNKTFATIHIEIDDRWSLTEAHRLMDHIEKSFKDELDVELVCHVDPIAIQNEKHTEVYRQVKKILQSYLLNLKFHDFQIEESEAGPTIHFDVVVPDDSVPTNEELFQAIERDIHQQIGPYPVIIEFDRFDLLKEVR